MANPPLLAAAFLLLLGCSEAPPVAAPEPAQGEEHNVHVNCVGTNAGFQCTAVHDQGAAAVNACWSVNVTCANGTTTSGSACADFQTAETKVVLIPMSDFPGSEQCDRATNTEVVTGAITRL